MKKNNLPPVDLYYDAASFFTDFIKLNKDHNPKFSYRMVASKLNWPVGYISDVIAGRKSLTLSRALQFSEYYKMNTVGQERLTWFALAETENDEVKNFFKRKLYQTPKDVLKPTITITDIEMYNTISAVCSFLVLKKKLMSSSEILEQLYLPFLTKEKIEKSLIEIEKNKYLVWSSSGDLIENNANFFFDNFSDLDGEGFVNLKLHKETTESFLHFINNPKSPSTYHSSLIQLKKGQFMSLALQIIALRNQFVEISEENIVSATEKDSHRLMQLDFNFFPVSDIK